MATFFLTIIFMGFVTLGLPDSGAGVIWPYLRQELGAPLQMAGIIGIVTTICSSISSVTSPILTKKVPVGLYTAICSTITGVAILLVSFSTALWQIFALSAVLGFAASGIDISLNNYVSARYPSSIMNWLHACWGLGALIGPLIITFFLNLNGSWRFGYRTIAAIQLFCALVLFATLGLWNKGYAKIKLPESESFATTQNSEVKWLAIGLSCLIFFIYVSAEISMGYWLNSLLVEFRHYNATVSGTSVSAYYGSIMVGRVVFGLFTNKLGNRRSIRLGLLISLVGAGLFFIKSVAFTYISVILIGLGFAPLYPLMMHETARRFKRELAEKLMGFQMFSACMGSLCVSPLIGVIGERYTLEYLCVAVLAAIVILLVSTIVLDRLTPIVTQNKPEITAEQ